MYFTGSYSCLSSSILALSPPSFTNESIISINTIDDLSDEFLEKVGISIICMLYSKVRKLLLSDFKDLKEIANMYN